MYVCDCQQLEITNYFKNNFCVFFTDRHLQVQVKGSKLECYSKSHLSAGTSYVWYKNGQEIWGGRSYYVDHVYSSDSYACAVRGCEDFPSPLTCEFS